MRERAGKRQLSYAAAPQPVRDDLSEAHREAWRRLAAPGTWWTGAERVAIAAEVRAAADCPLCQERGKGVSPHAGEGAHGARGALPEPAVDVIHRLTTDSGRLSRAWFDSIRAAGLEDAGYVEIVGVVVTVVSIDAFCRALGLPPHPLPQPEPGEPSRYRPAAACDDGAWVPMLPNGRARGAEADLWDTRRTGNVIRALSLVPDEVRVLELLSNAHYMSVHELTDPGAARGVLQRSQIELVAARISALRECFY